MNPSVRPPARAITAALLSWYKAEKRDLPWRGTRDPYRVWVSEVMLQQTTVAAVRKRFEPFLHRFPTLASLASARKESVLAAWSGLGYYGRARNLLRAARLAVTGHGGHLPRDRDALRRLPGFGEYTAAAVASIAFGERVPAVDANVERVLSRLFAIPGKAGSPGLRREVRRRAAELLPRRRPGDVTAALMDLGQLLCRPRRPDCPNCPLASDCVARREGRPERYPARSPKPRTLRVSVAAAEARSGGRTLLVRREGTLLAGLWVYPSADGRTPADARARLRRALAAHGLRIDGSAPFARATHTVVNRRLEIGIYRAGPNPKRARGSAPREGESVRWFRPDALARAAVPTLTRKIAIAAGFLSRDSVSFGSP